VYKRDDDGAAAKAGDCGPLAATGTIAGTATGESANPIAWIGVGAGDYDSMVNCEGPGGPNTPSDVAVTPDGTIYLAAIRSWNVYQTGRRDGDCEPGTDALVCLRVPAARAAAELRREWFLPLARRRDILDPAQDDNIPGIAVVPDAG
jgi:hypothetical protein